MYEEHSFRPEDQLPDECANCGELLLEDNKAVACIDCGVEGCQVCMVEVSGEYICEGAK